MDIKSLSMRIATVKERLQVLWDAEVITRQPYSKVLGSDNGPLNPPIAEDELLEFELENQVKIPDEYRLFLRVAGDGGVGPLKGFMPLKWRNGIKGDEPLKAISIAEFCISTEQTMWVSCALICTDEDFGSLVYYGNTAPQAGYFGDSATEYRLINTQESETPDDFLSWYERWLSLVEAHENTDKYGLPLDLKNFRPRNIIYGS